MKPKFQSAIENNKLISGMINQFNCDFLFDEGLETDKAAIEFLGSNNNDLEEDVNRTDWVARIEVYFKNLKTQLPEEQKGLADAVIAKAKAARTFVNDLDDFRYQNLMSRSDNLPERWDAMLDRADALKDMASLIERFNEATEYRFITDGGMQAAKGLGRAIDSMQNTIRIRLLEDASGEVKKETDRYRDDLKTFNTGLNEYLHDCSDRHYAPNELNTWANRLNEQNTRMGQKISDLADENALREKQINKIESGNLTEVQDRVLELELKQAALNYTALNQAYEKQKPLVANLSAKMNEDSKKLSDYTESISDTKKRERYEAAMNKLEFLYPALELTKKESLNEKDCAAMIDSMIKYYHMAGDGTHDKQHKAELAALTPAALKQMITDTYKASAEPLKEDQKLNSLFHTARESEMACFRETRVKNRLEKDKSGAAVNVETKTKALDMFRKKYAPKLPGATETAKGFLKLSPAERETVEKELNNAREELNGAQNLTPEEKKTRIDALKNRIAGNEEISKALTDGQKRIQKVLNPIQTSLNKKNELESCFNELRDTRTPLVNAAQQRFNDTAKTDDFVNKARTLITRFDANRRFLHRDSDEYKALKTRLEEYVQDPSREKMNAVKNAARTYMSEKKRGYHLEKTTSMRASRLAYAKDILDFASDAGTWYNRAEETRSEQEYARARFDNMKFKGTMAERIAADYPEVGRDMSENLTEKMKAVETPINELIKKRNDLSDSLNINLREAANVKKEPEAPQVDAPVPGLQSGK